MNFSVVGVGDGPVVVVRPRPGTYGHQVLEFLMGLYLARALSGAACYVFETPPACPAVFALECREVPILRGRDADRAAAAASRHDRLERVRGWPASRRARLERGTFDVLGLIAERFAPARAWRKRFKAYLGRRAAAGAGPAIPDFRGIDFRACYAREPLTFTLPPNLADRAAGETDALGLGAGARVVTLHVRESGFKLAGGGESPADALRNARVEDYRAACDRLTGQGFTVVRIGDPAMTPFAHPGVVDLATSPRRTELLEFSLLLRSVLFIAGDSGPYVTSYLTAVPCLATNVTNMLGGYPVHANDRYLLKHPVDRVRGRRLSLRDMLTTDYFETRKQLDRYAFDDNAPGELVDGVDEMRSVLGGHAVPSPAQDEFHRLADALYNSPVVAATRTRKGEPARQLLGDGRIGRAFAERFLDEG